MLGVLATCLFYGDAMITPAISVLSAVEGLKSSKPRSQPLVIPISIVILIGLFLVQSRGTAKVGALFGPVILIYLAALAVLGVTNICAHPEIVGALNPFWALKFFLVNPKLAFLALGSVFLAVTGAETLYADMGHFGRRAIGFSWLTLVYPCLTLNYLGPGRASARRPAAAARSLLPDGAGMGAAAARRHCHRGDDHRQPGGHLGRLLRHPPGGSARLPAAPEDRAYERESARGRSTSRRSTGACWSW